MSSLTNGIVGISIGAIIIIGIEYACYKLFSDELERKRAVVIGMACVFTAAVILAIIAAVMKD